MPLSDLPSKCVCGEKYTVCHALSCKKGGFVAQRHDGVPRLVQISSVVRVVLLAMCFDSWFLPSVLLCAIQGEISLFLTVILRYLAPATRYSSQFTFEVFFLKAVFGFTQALERFSAERKWYLLLCYTLLWFNRHFLGIPQSVDLLNMIQFIHILSRFKQDTYSSLWLFTILS